MKISDTQKQILRDATKRQIVLGDYNWCAVHSLIWARMLKIARDNRKAKITRKGVKAL